MSDLDHEGTQPIDWDTAYREEFTCPGDVAPNSGHAWYFPVAVGDWCICGGRQW